MRGVQGLFQLLPPEAAHGLALRLLALGLGPRAARPDPRLAVRVGGLRFPSPLGLAAGFDKDARAWRALLRVGFGFVEVGTLTPRPQAGNPGPRVFRLHEDRAVINRLGFNNAGVEAARARLRAHPQLGVNVGPNRDSPERLADFARAVAAVAPVAAWITLNVSSPNTPGLRDLQGAALGELVAAAAEARGPGGPPLFLKVSPDLDAAQVAAVARTAVESRAIAALVVGNTTLARPPGLRSRHAAQAGGLSGRPLMEPSTQVLARFAVELAGALPLVGVGGIASADDVLAKLQAGAVAVQLYTALVYEGLGLVARIHRDLTLWLDRTGAPSLAAAFDRPAG